MIRRTKWFQRTGPGERKNSFFKAAGGLGPSSVWKEASLDEKEGGCYQGEKEEGGVPLSELGRGNFCINPIYLNRRSFCRYSLWKYGNGHLKTYVSSFARDWTVKERLTPSSCNGRNRCRVSTNPFNLRGFISTFWNKGRSVKPANRVPLLY